MFQLKYTSMDLWGEESCRACLIRNDLSTMYDLAVPETMQLFNECSYLNFTLPDDPSENVPQHICNMCYRLCELWQSFRTRCQETEKKLKISCPGSSSTKTTMERVVAPLKGTDMKQESSEMVVEEDVVLLSEEDPLTADEQRLIRSPTQKDNNDTTQRKRKKRSAPPTIDPDTLEWGPGPNELGVWKYFQRSKNPERDFAKCLWSDCKKVVHYQKSSTGPLRYHLTAGHGVIVPSKKDDTGQPARPVEPEQPFFSEPEVSDSADFEWALSGDDQ